MGSDEILLDDSVRLEEKLKAAGVKVRLDIWTGMWHVFQVFAPYVPEAQLAIDQVGVFIREATQVKGAYQLKRTLGNSKGE